MTIEEKEAFSIWLRIWLEKHTADVAAIVICRWLANVPSNRLVNNPLNRAADYLQTQIA